MKSPRMVGPEREIMVPHASQLLFHGKIFMNPDAEDDANDVRLILIENFHCYHSKRGNFSKRGIFQKKGGTFKRGNFQKGGKFLFIQPSKESMLSHHK